MVLEIRLKNFFSIKDEIILDMRAANIRNKNAKKLKDNIFSYDNINVLKTVIIYGANASGKSNIIRAIRFCNLMILQSHNHNENTVFNFKPFKFLGNANEPSRYFIRFVSNGIEYEYSFELTVTQVVRESLYYYPKGRRAEIFTRDETKGKTKKEKYTFKSVIKRPWDVAENTSNKTLFISRASQMDRDIAKELFNYFYSKFLLGYIGFNVQQTELLFNQYKNKLLEALKIADSDIVDIKLKKIKSQGININANLTDKTLSIENIVGDTLKITTFHRSSPDIPFDFLTEESDGTKKLFFIMLSLLDIIKNDKIILIDEIGESLHNDIIEYIFNLFRTSGKAQLICTTHNTSFLDLNKFRKDQIYFVNKKNDGSTDLYSLYDFSDFRETMDLEKAYMQGRFDAKPFVEDDLDNLKQLLDD